MSCATSNVNAEPLFLKNNNFLGPITCAAVIVLYARETRDGDSDSQTASNCSCPEEIFGGTHRCDEGILFRTVLRENRERD